MYEFTKFEKCSDQKATLLSQQISSVPLVVSVCVFWNMELCGVKVFKRFGGIYWLHLHNWRVTVTKSEVPQSHL